MAQIDGSSNTMIKPVRSPRGAPAIRWFQESTSASSKAIAAGDPVCFDTVVSTHLRIVIAPSSQGAGANLLQNGITSLIGIALAASTSDGSTTGHLASTVVQPEGRYIPVALADGLTEFSINISSVGATPEPPASSMIGNTYPLECVRSAVGQRGPGTGHGVWFMSSTNLSTAADLSIVVTDVPNTDIGTTGGRVYFKFLSTMVSRAVRVGGPFT